MTTSLISLLKNPIHCVSLGFGAGLVPKAPGTAGTLLAVFFYFLLQHLTLACYLGFVAVAFLFGCLLCHATAKVLQQEDPAPIVWDEMVGYWFTMSFAPEGWIGIGLGFVLFRVFDIVKPWPIRMIERCVPGGSGIMLDDMMAGLYALIGLQIFIYLGFT